MPTKQGNPALINDPVAQELLNSNNLAHLAYTWTDGTPRMTPIWFYWNGQEVVLGTPTNTPKVRALSKNPQVVLMIDSSEWPYKVLQIRGTAQMETTEGGFSEYASSAARYFGEEQGQAWVENVKGMFPEMVRITIKPEWVGIFDFETRFPNAIETAMSG